LRRAVRRHFQSQLRPGLAFAFGGIIALLILVAAIMLMLEGFELVPVLTFSMMLPVAVYWFVLRNQVNEWCAMRGFDQSPAANVEVLWEISEAGLAQECKGLSSLRADWKLVSKVVDAGDGYLLYTYRQTLFYWLPFSGFEGPHCIDGFQNLIRERPIEFVQLSRTART
jgi:hypothetical protein